MSTLLIHNVRVMRPRVGVIGSAVLVEHGRIAAIDPTDVPPGCERADGRGRLLTPGLIDLHTHGIGRHLYEASPEAIRGGLALLPRFGVTCVLPTLYRVMDAASLEKLAELAGALEDAPVSAPGFHLEGPFLALPGAGAATVPGDVRLLKDLIDATAGRVAAMSISPDTPNILPVIEYLRELGIVPYITHTRASVDESLAAIEAGARHATHFYDVFPVPEVTEPGVRPVGVVEAVLADERVSVDFIADGVHVHPVAIRAALRAKGPEKTILITDSNIGAGLPEGVHETPWGFPVRVRSGDAARIHLPGSTKDGGLAGSALTMDRGVTNLLGWLDLPEHDVWAMATLAPARCMGLNRKGDLGVGSDADLVLWDRKGNELRAAATWVAGRLVYDAERKAEEALT